MKKIVLLLILLFVFVFTAVSCGSDTGVETQTTDTQVIEETTIEEIVYDYPQMDFGGAEFRFLVLRSNYWGQDINDLWTENLDGESLNDAVYERNLEVENKYNVKITATETGNVEGDIQMYINAGDDMFHMIQTRAMNLLGVLAPQSFLYNFYDIPYINYEAPWYDQNCINELSIANKLFVISGDVEVSDKIGINCLLFNKNMLDDLQLESPYEIIRSGGWTMDKFYDTMITATHDINGDGELTKDDRWGFIVEDFGGWMLLEAAGCKVALKDNNDMPYLNIYNERVETVLQKVMKIMYATDGRTGSNFLAEDFERMFMNDQALFSYAAMSSIPPFRDMESDFGIIPLPKFDENQGIYYSPTSGFVARPLGVPISNSKDNFEMIGVILDAMSRESTDTVKIAYYDKLLHGKIARDDESSEMLDIIFSNIAYDIGATFNWAGSWFKYQEFFLNKMDNFASFYETYSGVVETEMQKSIDVFKGN